MQELSALIKMFDGEASEKHVLEVGLDDIRKWHVEIEQLRAALAAERKRCAGIIQLARFGEIDGDLRCLISRIEGGDTLDQIAAERGADVEAKPDAS
jgi:hypothetical protein